MVSQYLFDGEERGVDGTVAERDARKFFAVFFKFDMRGGGDNIAAVDNVTYEFVCRGNLERGRSDYRVKFFRSDRLLCRNASECFKNSFVVFFGKVVAEFAHRRADGGYIVVSVEFRVGQSRFFNARIKRRGFASLCVRRPRYLRADTL